MISSITLENFKSYENAEMPLAPLTFLVGANASGKSNALEAIRLLVELAKGKRLDDIERDIQKGDTFIRGQAEDIFRKKGEMFEIGCRFDSMPEKWNYLTVGISISNERLVIQKECVTQSVTADDSVPLYEIASAPPEMTDEVSVAYNNFAKGRNKPRVPCSNRQAMFYQLTSPSRFGENHKKSQEIIPETTSRIRQELHNIVFLDPQPSTMRGYSPGKDNIMREDGSNLSSVLKKIRDGSDSQKEQLLGFVRSLPEQDITDIAFSVTDRNDVMVRLQESFGGMPKMTDAPLLSDGTLRVLAIAATLLTAEKESLVIIEEIDNGVHPSRAGTLVKQIQTISNERNLRVLVTTHNPALLDSLSDDSLGDVLCCYRDPGNGGSKITRLGDLERYPELVAQGSLGELVTRLILDRFLKDNTSEERRVEQSIRWLEKLKKEVAQ